MDPPWYAVFTLTMSVEWNSVSAYSLLSGSTQRKKEPSILWRWRHIYYRVQAVWLVGHVLWTMKGTDWNWLWGKGDSLIWRKRRYLMVPWIRKSGRKGQQEIYSQHHVFYTLQLWSVRPGARAWAGGSPHGLCWLRPGWTVAVTVPFGENEEAPWICGCFDHSSRTSRPYWKVVWGRVCQGSERKHGTLVTVLLL